MDLSNSSLLENEPFSNFRILGIGKRSDKEQNKIERVENRIEKKEEKGKDTTKLVGKLDTLVGVKKGAVAPTRGGADAEASATPVSRSLSVGREVASKDSVSRQDAKTDATATDDAGADVTSDKFLGMPKTTGIIVTVVGSLAIVIGSYFLYKKIRG